jgi:ATPase subunit of ABC transporter with duplicated ATPase domains
VAERIVELEGGVLEEYRGDYTYYREEKVRRAAQRALPQTRTVKGMSPQKGRLAGDNKKKH